MRYEFLLNEQNIAMFSRREAVHVFPKALIGHS